MKSSKKWRAARVPRRMIHEKYQKVARSTEKGDWSFRAEALGSTVNVLDNSASQVVSYWYDDFGDVTESKASGYASFDNELQYTGAVHDASTGLLYLNARFYDPQTGRFISRDTYRGERNNADTWHLYLYCANNPVNYVDPSGHYYQAVKLGYNTYRVARAAAAAGTLISTTGGTILIVVAVVGVVWYAGTKFAKVKTKSVAKKGTRGKSKSKAKSTNKKQKFNVRKQDSPVWNKFKKVKGKERRYNGSGSNKRYYEWDHTHNDIEVYDSKGKHLGSLDPKTGNMYKKAVNGRRIKL